MKGFDHKIFLNSLWMGMSGLAAVAAVNKDYEMVVMFVAAAVLLLRLSEVT